MGCRRNGLFRCLALREASREAGWMVRARPGGASQTLRSSVSDGWDVLSAGQETGGQDRAGVRLEAVVATALAGVLGGLEGLEARQRGARGDPNDRPGSE